MGSICDEIEQHIDVHATAGGTTYGTQAAALAAAERAVRKFIRRKGNPCNEPSEDNKDKGLCIRVASAKDIDSIITTFQVDATVNEEEDDIEPRWSWRADGQVDTWCMWILKFWR